MQMKILVQTAEHAYAIAAQDLVKAAKFIRAEVVPALKAIISDEGVIEKVTDMVDPAADNVERAAFAVLGMLLKAIDGAGATDGGVKIELDAELIAELKQIGAALKGKITVPAGVAK